MVGRGERCTWILPRMKSATSLHDSSMSVPGSTRVWRPALRASRWLLGESCLHWVPSTILPANAVLRHVGPGWVIDVRENLNASQLNRAVAHELAEWFLRCQSYVESDFDELSGRMAAALCVPRSAFELAHRIVGDDLRQLSRWFRVSESLMALRCAECLGPARALITPNKVRTRGEAWAWPSAREDWNRLSARPQEAGLVLKIPSDARGRVILRVA